MQQRKHFKYSYQTILNAKDARLDSLGKHWNGDQITDSGLVPMWTSSNAENIGKPAVAMEGTSWDAANVTGFTMGPVVNIRMNVWRT